MKRWIACLAAAVLLLCAMPALAADYPLEEKLLLQIQKSAYRATVTFECQGAATAAMPRETWQMLKALAPRLSLTASHSLFRGSGQAEATLLMDGESAGRSLLLYNNEMMGFASDLMAGADSFYTLPADADAEQLLLGGGDGWPPVWHMILEAQRADAEWQARAEKRLSALRTELEIWLNSYTAYSTGSREDGVDYTELACTLPAPVVKEGVKHMLSCLYADEELLSLLREAVTPREAAAYLQPASLDALLPLVDALPLTGEAAIVRRYDALGEPLLDEISLPFPDSAPLAGLTISLRPAERGREWAFSAAARTGEEYFVTCVSEKAGTYAGAVRAGRAGEESPLIFTYTLTWEDGEEQYSLSTDKFERTVKGLLEIRPGEGMAWPAQSLSLEAQFSSGSLQSSATRLNAALTWRDLEGDATVSAVLESKTAAPFEVARLEDAENAVRLDEMGRGELSALTGRWQESCEDWLDALLLRLTGNTARPTGE